jgi:hypothetical protein
MERRIGCSLWNHITTEEMIRAIDILIPDRQQYYMNQYRDTNNPIYDFLCSFKYSEVPEDTSFYDLIISGSNDIKTN